MCNPDGFRFSILLSAYYAGISYDSSAMFQVEGTGNMQVLRGKSKCKVLYEIHACMLDVCYVWLYFKHNGDTGQVLRNSFNWFC